MKKETKTIKINMSYIYVGETSIEIPETLLKDKNKQQQLEIAYEYAQTHLRDIPIADYLEYIPDSDNFEMEDIELED